MTKFTDMILFLVFLLPVTSSAQNITDTTIVFTLKTARHNPFTKKISINTYSQLYLQQSGVGSGFTGAEYDFKKKVCWGLGLQPEYNLNGHLFSIHFEYDNKILHYYCIPVVFPPSDIPDSLDSPYQSKSLIKNRYHYFCCGLGYGYQFKVNDLTKISIEIHFSDRILPVEKQRNEFYLAPYLSFNIKDFGIFFKENIQLSRERWESETISSALGVNYKIKLFEK